MVTREDLERLKSVLDNIGDDIGITCKELELDYKIAKDFYVHDKDEMKELGSSIIDADVIMENLSSDKINGIMKLTKGQFEGKSVEILAQIAGASALSCLLALTRMNYLSVEEENNTDEGTDESD